MRIVFMGTPQFAVPSLKALIEAGHEVCGVFSQPDKPVGRHQNKLKPTPVKECALSYQAAGRDIPVYQPEKLRDGTALAILKELAPELIVVAAYGRILPDDILALPPKGCINVHSSLLPKYRGAAPINWAILNGEKETGVTIMHMAAGAGRGGHHPPDGHSHPPGGGRGDALCQAGGAGRPASGGGGGPDRGRDRRRTPQDPNGVSFAPMLSKELSPVDWSRSAQEIHDQIRGLMAWPRASTDVLGGEAVKLYRSQVLAEKRSGTAGTVLGGGKAGIDVLCGDGKVLRITELQAPGSRRMSAADYLRGHPLGN